MYNKQLFGINSMTFRQNNKWINFILLDDALSLYTNVKPSFVKQIIKPNPYKFHNLNSM